MKIPPIFNNKTSIIVSDEKLFTIVLYSAFVNNDFLTSVRDIWKDSWVIGIAAASALGLAGWLISPIILMAIIHGLGFGVEGVTAGSFAAWFMSLYEGFIVSGSIISILQSIGAAGLGSLGTSISGGVGAAIGILIGAVGGSNLANHLKEMELNKSESQMLSNLVQVDEYNYSFQNNSMVIFTLMPALLYNDVMLESFVKTFITCSHFAESKLFKFYYTQNGFSKLRLEDDKANNTIYNLLVNEYEDSRVKYIFHNGYLIEYDLDLNNYETSNLMIKLLVEIWKFINGNTVLDIDLDKIKQKIVQFFHDIGIDVDFNEIKHQAGQFFNNTFQDVKHFFDKFNLTK